VRSDSSAAIGITSREGLGKLRHINVQYLWVQERFKEDNFKLSKVPGEDNPADIFTKYLDVTLMQRHLTTLNLGSTNDRAASAPKLAMLTNRNQEPFNSRLDFDRVGSKLLTLASCGLKPWNSSALKANHYGGILGCSYAESSCAESSEHERLRSSGVSFAKEKDKTVIVNKETEDANDHWQFEDSYCVRKHDEPRFRLFTPLGVTSSPPARCLFSVRITRGAFCDDGQEFELVDSWKNRANAHMSLGRPWLGTTTFYGRHPDHM
jgi:hypothetical protein